MEVVRAAAYQRISDDKAGDEHGVANQLADQQRTAPPARVSRGARRAATVPPGGRAEVAPLAIAAPVMLDLRVDIEPFMRAMRQMAIVVNRAMGSWSELLRKLAPTAEVITEARRERLSAMHREYHRRSQARRRRRR